MSGKRSVKKDNSWGYCAYFGIIGIIVGFYINIMNRNNVGFIIIIIGIFCTIGFGLAFSKHAGNALDLSIKTQPEIFSRLIEFVKRVNKDRVEFLQAFVGITCAFQFNDENNPIAWVEVENGKIYAGMGKHLNPTSIILLSKNSKSKLLSGSLSDIEHFFHALDSIIPKPGVPEREAAPQIKPLIADRKPTPSPGVPLASPFETTEPPKDLIDIHRQYEYIGGKVRIKVKITNKDQSGLLRLRAMLDIPESFRLLRIEPPDYARDGAIVKINDLLPNEEKAVAWVLEPLICGKEKIGGTISGNKASGEPFAIPINPLEVTVRCPLFIAPEKANLAIVQRIIVELPVKSERVFYLPPSLSPTDAMAMVQGVISERDVSQVGTLKGAEDPEASFNESTWYYGVTKVGQKRYIIIITVIEDDRTIRIFSACDDEAGCTGFLAEAGASLRIALLKSGIYESERDVRELICEKCGATLMGAPRPGHNVECPDCRWTWKEADFFSNA